MSLFSKADVEAINKIAAKSRQSLQPAQTISVSNITDDLNRISKNVEEYFKDSDSILIQTREELHEYIDNVIEAKYFGIDTETTGLDRYKDYIVGCSLYYPGGVKCYIPNKHKVPIFENLYPNQLSYQDVGEELQRLVDADTHAIFANADFDLSMIYKDYKVDMCSIFYYDVILAWRCLKENELKNNLKALYTKYVLRGKGDPKRFSDFFTPQLFPFCKPAVAKLYAANDAQITYELYKWQLPYVTPAHKKCQKNKLEQVARIVWNIEFPLVQVCQHMHRAGLYIDSDISSTLNDRYNDRYHAELLKLQNMVQDAIDKNPALKLTKAPFSRGTDFNPSSPPQVKYLCYDILNLPKIGNGSTGKEVLREFNHPITNQILNVRSLATLIGTFVEKLPKSITPDNRIHANFKQLGASTGRFSSENPNCQNIPSRAKDIRHMFRATPSMTKSIECKEISDNISVVLSRYDSVQSSDQRTYVKVYDLKVDDKIILYDNSTKQSVLKQIVSIDCADDSAMVQLTLQ